MDKILLRKALSNSAILAFMFMVQMIVAIANGSAFGVIVSLLAAGLSANDAIKFYEASKALKASEQTKEEK